MPSIFISFRKADNRWMRDRIYQALAEAFGPDEIFKSGESIPAGGDFGAILHRQAAECKLMLVLIGTAWSDARDAGGERLLDRQDDWVRVEIATALKAGNRVVPVLLGDAAMLPAPVALPDDITELAQLQFLRVPETHLDDGLRRLVTTVSGLLPELGSPAAHGPVPAGPAPVPSGAPTLTQNTGGGNAVSIQGGAKKARVAGGNIRETKVHTGGVFATATTFLTTKAGIATAIVVVTATSATVAATTSDSGGSSSPSTMFAGTAKDYSSGVGTVPSGPVTTTLRVTGTTDNGPIDVTVKPTVVRCGHTTVGHPGVEIYGPDTADGTIRAWELEWSVPPVFPQGHMSGQIQQTNLDYVGVPRGFAWDLRHVSFSGVTISPSITSTVTITGKLSCTTDQ